MRKKVLVIFGTRPEAIKLVPVIKKLKDSPEFDLRICITAQHREMLDSVLSSFDIVPDYDMSVMQNGQTLFYITGKIISGLEDILKGFCPDIVLVHGDTTTAYAGALAAFYYGARIAHIEAGLRSQNIYSPFPEEFNRRSISLMASLHFAPTLQCEKNLISEGVDVSKIFTVGNTVIDILSENIRNSNDFICPYNNFAILTVHRREHSSEKLTEIFEAIKEICIDNPEFSIVYPVHKSPRVSKLAKQVLSHIPNLILCDPLEVKFFHLLLSKCNFVITDSGGIQEEASFLGKPTLILRENTERPEATSMGTSRLIGNKRSQIIQSVQSLISSDAEYEKMAKRCLCFGDGHAAEKIIDILKKY